MCEIDPNIGVIPEDASQNPQPEWRQGFNSCFSNMEEIDNDLTVAQAILVHVHPMLIIPIPCVFMRLITISILLRGISIINFIGR